MDISRKPNGKWELRWREGGQRRSRTFDRKTDATAFEVDRIRRKQLGHAAVPDDVPLREFVETGNGPLPPRACARSRSLSSG